MNETFPLLSEHEHEHEHKHDLGFSATAEVATVAGVLSLTFGLATIVTNSVLLFTLCKDPCNYFLSRGTTYFIASLSVSDFLAGFVVQPLYSVCMFSSAQQKPISKLCEISLILSHVTTKVSIFTVVALSLDRYLAVKLSWRYNSLVTVRKVTVCNIGVWLFCGIFEATHSEVDSESAFHLIDLHLQTTVPLIILCAIYTATYHEFRRHSRNVVFVQSNADGRSRTSIRNIRLEKKIVWTILMIIIVLFISLLPYLITNNLEERCFEKGSSECSESSFTSVKVLSIPLLCVSCSLNPFLYAWKIPHYKQSLRLVANRTCCKCLRQNQARNMMTLNRPSVLASESLFEQMSPPVVVAEVEQDCKLR